MDETTVEPGGDRSAGRLARWVLLTGNRLLVSLVILAGIGVAVFGVGVLGIATVATPSVLMWYLNGTVNGLLTLVPITVGVNQIVLSHEFGSIEDLYDRRTDITDFRERVEECTEPAVVPPHASPFFGTLLAEIQDTGRALQQRADRTGDETTDDVGAVAESVVGEAARVNDELTADTNMLQAFLVMLSYENSLQFHEVRRLRTVVADDGETADELERILELFVEVDAARQYLKTVVVERQLARLSRLLVYTGIPAVTIAAVAILTYRDIATPAVPHLLLVGIAGTIVVTTLVPLAILGAYILRVATIARQTASYGPFVPGSE